MPEKHLFHLCEVIDYVRNQIKKRRVEKRLTQSDVAIDLGITPGAYSKIESGPTEITLRKLGEIADILEVDITYFFKNTGNTSVAGNTSKTADFASKDDLEHLTRLIDKMKDDMLQLKSSLQTGVKGKKSK